MIVPDDASTFDLLQTSEEWHIVFYISAGIYLIGCAFYAVFASGSRQPWAQTAEGTNAKPVSAVPLQDVSDSHPANYAQQHATQQ